MCVCVCVCVCIAETARDRELKVILMLDPPLINASTDYDYNELVYVLFH